MVCCWGEVWVWVGRSKSRPWQRLSCLNGLGRNGNDIPFLWENIKQHVTLYLSSGAHAHTAHTLAYSPTHTHTYTHALTHTLTHTCICTHTLVYTHIHNTVHTQYLCVLSSYGCNEWMREQVHRSWSGGREWLQVKDTYMYVLVKEYVYVCVCMCVCVWVCVWVCVDLWEGKGVRQASNNDLRSPGIGWRTEYKQFHTHSLHENYM